MAAPSGAATAESAVADLIHERERGTLDEPIPALDNRTPHAAATQPAFPPKLIR